MDKNSIIALSVIGFVSAMGAVTTVALDKVVTKYGHSFMQIGPKSVLLIGTVGAVQNLAAMILSVILILTVDEMEEHEWIAFLAGSTITAGILVGLTALAARVNLISARLSLFAGAALVFKSCIETFIASRVADELTSIPIHTGYLEYN